MATFTNTSRNPLSWQAPADGGGVDRFLLISDDYKLLINDTNRLIIQPGRVGTTWTEVTKTGR